MINDWLSGRGRDGDNFVMALRYGFQVRGASFTILSDEK